MGVFGRCEQLTVVHAAQWEIPLAVVFKNHVERFEFSSAFKALIAGGDIAYHDYEGIATDLEERERLVEDLGNKNVMILRNHGTLAVGDSVAACFVRLYFLERACEAQVKMLSAGCENLNTPPQGTPEKVAEQSAPGAMGMVAQALAWPALLRKLDRIDPSYRS